MEPCPATSRGLRPPHLAPAVPAGPPPPGCVCRLWAQRGRGTGRDGTGGKGRGAHLSPAFSLVCFSFSRAALRPGQGWLPLGLETTRGRARPPCQATGRQRGHFPASWCGGLGGQCLGQGGAQVLVRQPPLEALPE